MMFQFDQLLQSLHRRATQAGPFYRKLLANPWLAARLGAIAFVFLAGSGFLYLKFTHQLTPGPLSTFSRSSPLGGVASHAELSTQCTHCHAPVHCLSDTRCQDCHKQIAQDRKDSSTLHGRLPGVQRCQNCHPEHRGAQADLTELAFTYVDHYLLAGFSLEHHAHNYNQEDMNCFSCHAQAGNIAETTDCVSCHAANDHDYIAKHIEEHGTACADCHDGKDRMVDGFDHDQVFVIAGAHTDLTCVECHTQKQYAGQGSGCAECHAEPAVHAGDFGSDCAACHSETAWSPAELKQHAFNLQCGDKVVEDCKACHTTSYTSYTCVACHADDKMKTVQTHAENVEYHDCVSCHVDGMDTENARQPQKQSRSGQDPLAGRIAPQTSPAHAAVNVSPGSRIEPGKEGSQ